MFITYSITLRQLLVAWGWQGMAIVTLTFFHTVKLCDKQYMAFYRAMHYSAKRSCDRKTVSSVRLLVCNVGGSGSHTGRSTRFKFVNLED